MRVVFNRRRLLAVFLAVAVLASIFTVAFAGMATAAETQLDTSMTLYQVGNQLKNGKGEVVRLLGVNVPHYCWSLVGDNDAERALEIALNDWQSNCIRLAVKPSFWLGRGSTSASQAAAYRARIDAFIERVVKAGKYVVLDNHSFYLPGEDSELFWADAAERYKNHPNVIFGLFNEPANCTWKQFYEGAENYTYVGTNDWGQNDNIKLNSKGVPNLMKIVRATGAKNLVTISGLTWGFDLEYMTESRLRGFAYDQAEEKIRNNQLAASERDAWIDAYVEKYGIRETTGNGIMFETHPYPDRKNWDTYLLDTLREYPVLVGECGPTKLKDGITSSLDAEEKAYMDQLTSYMDKHRMHLTAWAMGAWPHLVYTTNYNRPSAYGQIIKDYIIANVNGGSNTPTDPDGPNVPGTTPANLLTKHMKSIKSVSQDKTTGAVTDSTVFNGVLTTLTDGIIPTNNTDISSDKWGVTGSGTPKAGTANVGVQITLDKAYNLSTILLYQGISSHPDYVRVYASEKLEDLYKASSLVADDAKTSGLLELKTTVKAQYIAVLVTKTTIYSIARVKEYMVMGLENSDHAHDYKATVIPPTCTERGYTTYTCHCGHSYVGEYVSATGHSYGKWTVTDEPACLEKGEQRRDCVNCDHYETDEVSALGHNLTWYAAKAPTCTTIGWSAYETCSRCNHTTYVKRLATGHSYGEWVEFKLPTTTAKGEERRTCKNCDHYESREIPKLTLSGWVKENGKWCYYQNGKKATNKWLRDSVSWCYVGADGYCVTNCWQKDSVGWCYLGQDGRMVTNKWVRDSVSWCYVGADGYCVTNCWKRDSVGWCYLGQDGRMVTNKWVKDSVGWCYVDADGYAVTNCWKKDSVGWCYLNSNGSMTKSAWVKDGGKWYYLDANGYMVAGKTLTIGSKRYTFNAAGVWVS